MAGFAQQGQTKKLVAAAEHWAGGGKDSSKQLDDDAATFGVIIEEEEKPEHFEVWPENWDAIDMWLRVQTQWRTSTGGAIGLDYSVLAWFFKMYAVEDQRALLEDLQIMEGAALAVMNREA